MTSQTDTAPAATRPNLLRRMLAVSAPDSLAGMAGDGS